MRSDAGRTAATWAPYMRWAKTRPHPRLDLAGSNLLACTLDDLPGAREAVELSGDNDTGYRPLLEAIAAHYGTEPDRVAPAAGCSGANFLALAAVLRPGDEVLVERPAYDPLVGAARFLGARVRRFDRPFDAGFDVDPERVAAALSPATRLVVITDPHNPSGVSLRPEVLDEVGRRAAAVGARVLVDEVYLDAAGPGQRPPAASRDDVFISTSSLTKSYGLAGLRCGWALASPELVEAMNRVRDVVDGTAAFAADRLSVVAFECLDALADRARAILAPARERLAAFVATRPELAWVPPGGGTVAFPRLLEGDVDDLATTLLEEHHTAVVPGRFFDAPDHFRVGFGCAPDVLRDGLEALGRALDGRGGRAAAGPTPRR